MPSALERIQSLRIQRREETLNDLAQRSKNKSSQQIEMERQQLIERQHQEVVERILRETRILEQLREIEINECSQYRRHAVVLRSYDIGADITLAWGKYFTVTDDGKIGLESDGPTTGRVDYFSVNVHIDTKTESIRIGEKVISNELRYKETEVIPDLIASKFLNPDYVSDSHEFPKYYQRPLFDGRGDGDGGVGPY